eukprot:TRINITY_DN15009_c0_g1_i1.p2 TRINITY_DN15009_c0_g1~~TRINITY_DN15009_c0_g1_i1.p2  ORF type:complete len:490 (+),score=146.99 TRINITY_DN15009_c0_g1_i1:78-1547(+)
MSDRSRNRPSRGSRASSGAGRSQSGTAAPNLNNANGWDAFDESPMALELQAAAAAAEEGGGGGGPSGFGEGGDAAQASPCEDGFVAFGEDGEDRQGGALEKGPEGSGDAEEEEEGDGKLRVTRELYDQYHSTLRRLFQEDDERADMYCVERVSHVKARKEFNERLCDMEDDSDLVRTRYFNKKEALRLEKERLAKHKKSKRQQQPHGDEGPKAGGVRGGRGGRPVGLAPGHTDRMLRYNPWLYDLYYPHMFGDHASRLLTPIEKLMYEIDGVKPDALLDGVIEGVSTAPGAIQVGREWYIHVRDFAKFLQHRYACTVGTQEFVQFVHRYHSPHPLLSTEDVRELVREVLFAPEMRYLVVFTCFLKIMHPRDASKRDLRTNAFKGNETTSRATLQELVQRGNPTAKRALAFPDDSPDALPFAEDRAGTLPLPAFVKTLRESQAQFGTFLGVMVDTAYDMQSRLDFPAGGSGGSQDGDEGDGTEEATELQG